MGPNLNLNCKSCEWFVPLANSKKDGCLLSDSQEIRIEKGRWVLIEPRPF